MEKTIRFTEDVTFKREGKPDKFFAAGTERTMRADKATRWVTRGVAVVVKTPAAVAAPEVSAPAVEVEQEPKAPASAEAVDVAQPPQAEEVIQPPVVAAPEEPKAPVRRTYTRRNH